MMRAVTVATWLTALLLLSNVAAGLTTKSAARRLMGDSSDSSESNEDDSSGAENPSRCYDDEDKYEFEIKENMACKDENYIVYRDVSQTVCEEQCACRSDCVAFTYNYQDCFLKQTCYNREWHSYDMSGFKNTKEEEKPQPEPTFDPAFCDANFPAEFEVKSNFACKDPSLKVLRDMSEADCQSQCRCEDDCVGYTYNAYRGDCYLKASCNKGEWHPDDKSGMKIQVAYTKWPKTQCLDPIITKIWYAGNAARSKCQSACSKDSNCGSFTFNTRNWKCELFNTCYNKAWNRDAYTEIKDGAGNPPYIPPPVNPPPVNPPPVIPPPVIPPPVNPPPVVVPPKGCNTEGLPFGLGNCACDGSATGAAAGRKGCLNVKAQCSLSLQPFSAGQDDLLADIQRICDTLGVNACLNTAQVTALEDPECFALLSQEGAGRCSTQEARTIFEGIAFEECVPICPDCVRLP